MRWGRGYDGGEPATVTEVHLLGYRSVISCGKKRDTQCKVQGTRDQAKCLDFPGCTCPSPPLAYHSTGAR